MKARLSQSSLGITSMSLAVAAACAPAVTLTPLGDQGTYPATPDSVAVPLYATTRPECPYDEIAAITVEDAKEDKALSALIAKARAVGAHAILGYNQSTRSVGEISSTYVRSGTAIRYRSTECMR